MKRLLVKICMLVLVFVPIVSVNAQSTFDAMPPTMIAEDFKLFDSQGEHHTLSSHLGKFVVVNFWSTECLSCRAELTTLDDMLSLMPDYPIDVIGVHAGADVDGVLEMLEITPVSFPIVFDSELTLGGWGVPILPTTFIIDPEGRFVYRAMGNHIWNAPGMVDFMKGLIDNYEPYSNREAL